MERIEKLELICIISLVVSGLCLLALVYSIANYNSIKNERQKEQEEIEVLNKEVDEIYNSMKNVYNLADQFYYLMVYSDINDIVTYRQRETVDIDKIVNEN